jgi:c(7)-type cytochrome triheme protein
MSTSRGCRAAATLAGTLLLGSLIIDLNALPGVRAAGDAPAEDLRLPPDLIYDSEDDSPDAVVFRHSSHVAFTDTDCLACHPQPFKMLNPDRRVSHAEMDAGRQCGICHDGDNASGTADGDACTTCHTGVQAAPRDVVLAAGPIHRVR